MDLQTIQDNYNMTEENKKMSPTAFVLNLVMSAVFFPALTLGLAGNIRWVEGWIFGLWFDAMILFNIIYLYCNVMNTTTTLFKKLGNGTILRCRF